VLKFMFVCFVVPVFVIVNINDDIITAVLVAVVVVVGLF
jgi:hypothetical protein